LNGFAAFAGGALGNEAEVKFVRRCVVAAAVVPLLAAGCSEDPQPKFDQSPSPSPTGSSSDSAAPEAWEVKSEEGAVAFAKHWIDVFNEAGKSGDTSRLRQLSGRRCNSCSNFADMIEDLYSGGGHLETQGWSVLAAVPVNGLPDNEPRISLRIHQSPQKVYEGESGSVDSFPGGKATFSARLTWVPSSWSMSELVIIE
jgi:Family of unknown function (DUF6318)